VHNHQLARVIHDERQREIERSLRMRAERGSIPPGHSIRQAIGRLLIRFGSLLAAEGQLEAGQFRSSGQPEIRP
jgi:hypothetical protein